MKQRILSMVLTACLCLGLLSPTALASPETTGNLSITKDQLTTYYDTLAEAFASAESGDEIAVLQSYTEHENAEITDKSVVLDFGENKITAGSGTNIVVSEGSLTVRGSTGGYDGTFMLDDDTTSSSMTIQGGEHANIVLGAGGLLVQGGKITEMILQHPDTRLTVREGTIGLLMVYGGTTSLEGGTYTGLTVPGQELLSGKGILAFPGDPTSMQGMLAAEKAFDQEVQTQTVTDNGAQYQIAYCVGPVKVADEVSSTDACWKNDGYPYGKDMSGNNVTLVIEAENAHIYQWQTADAKDGVYAEIDGATHSTLSLSAPSSGSWYRCVVNGTESRGVQIVSPGKDGRTWMDRSGNYYITNGTMAYRVNGTEFDVAGLYRKNGTEYMLQTSSDLTWKMYSSANPEPGAVHYMSATPANLKTVRISFYEKDPHTLLFEVGLCDTEQAFSFGTDTKLGNYHTSGTYADYAALIAAVKDDELEQISMIGAESEAVAGSEDPSFVIAPVGEPTADNFWIGVYDMRRAYVYHTKTPTLGDGHGAETVDGTAVITGLEGRDSGLMLSWLNLTEDDVVRFRFSVGSVTETNSVPIWVTASAIDSPTGTVTLDMSKAASDVVVKVDGTALAEGMDYTIDDTIPLQPKITFLEAAGLTKESEIIIEVLLIKETQTNAVKIQNLIPPTKYSVTFRGGDGATGTAPTQEPTAAGDTFMLPENLFIRPEYSFTGWSDDSGIYQQGAVYTMPPRDVTFTAQWVANPAPPAVYTVTYHSNGGTGMMADQVFAQNVEEALCLNSYTCTGYNFTGWNTAADGSGTAYTDGQRVTIAADMTLYAQWRVINNGSGNTSPTLYPIIVEETQGGDVVSDRTRASSGTTVTVTVEAAEGFGLDCLTVTDKWGNAIRLNEKGEGKYTFRMPASKVIVRATIRSLQGNGYLDCPRDETCPIWPFTDADPFAWYHDGVHYCLKQGYITGYGNGILNPNGFVTRQQVWMMLARVSGAEPASMEEVREWAMEQEISDGSNPTNAVTRQQLVTLLWRHVKYLGCDVSAGEDTNILSYEDAFSISEYAIPAMQWACGEGIVAGFSDGTLKPLGNMTRAQFATVLMRYLEACG